MKFILSFFHHIGLERCNESLFMGEFVHFKFMNMRSLVRIKLTGCMDF